MTVLYHTAPVFGRYESVTISRPATEYCEPYYNVNKNARKCPAQV